MTERTYSAEGLALTKRFEGLELKAYQDHGGVWTIGYGHTGPAVFEGLVITEAQAEKLLESDIAGAVAEVNFAVKPDLTQGQFDALVDFVFNLGIRELEESTLLHELNAGNFAAAAAEFPKWDHCKGVVLPGLLERRIAERLMFQEAVS